MSDYNNHEYLYSLISLFLAGTDAHYISFSKNSGSYSFGMFLITLGTGYMMFCNAIYGIAGSIAVFGMSCIYLGASLILDTGDKTQIPNISSYHYWILQIFFGSIYFFAGIAKLDDDWLSGSTARELYQSWIGPTPLKPLLDDTFEQGWPLVWIAYCGMLFDILVPFGLVFPHPWIRLLFTCFALGFHLMNHFTFVIETFPWVMITTLVIYFDCDWIIYLNQLFHRVFNILTEFPLSRYIQRSFQLITPLSLLFLLGIHLFIALPCATFTLLNEKSINFSSQCQFFSWRMMTRSAKLFTFLVYLKNYKTNEIDPIILNQFHLSPEEISSISIHEDYLHQVALKLKSMAISSTSSGLHIPPSIMADIWIQINGPPIQRYVIPSEDLSLGPTSNSLKMWIALLNFQYQPKTYPWLEEPIHEFRTPFWREIFRNITNFELQSSRKSQNNLEINSILTNELLFFTDRSGPDRILLLFIKEVSLLRILAGQIYLQGYGTVTSDECLLIQGYLHITVRLTIHSNEHNNNNTSLWMIRNHNHSVIVLPKYSSSKKYSPLRVYDRYSCPLHSISSFDLYSNYIPQVDYKSEL